MTDNEELSGVEMGQIGADYQLRAEKGTRALLRQLDRASLLELTKAMARAGRQSEMYNLLKEAAGSVRADWSDCCRERGVFAEVFGWVTSNNAWV